MTGFGTYDRYDFALFAVFGAIWVCALVLNAPLWALVLILFTLCVVDFIRHFDEIMRP
jgi:hypothetical protein